MRQTVLAIVELGDQDKSYVLSQTVYKNMLLTTQCVNVRSFRKNYICTAGMTKSIIVTLRHQIILSRIIVAAADKPILCALSEIVGSTVPARTVQSALLAVTQCKTSTSHGKLYQEQQKHDDHVLHNSMLSNMLSSTSNIH